MVDNATLPLGEAFPEYIIKERIPDEREDFEVYEAVGDNFRRVRLVCCMPDPLRPDMPTEKEFQRRFERLRSIQHPSVPGILGGGVRGKVRWVAVEAMPIGTVSLRDVLGVVGAVSVVFPLLRTVASALSLAAEARIYHGDLCPELIVVPAGLEEEGDEKPRVLDLGFVQLFGERLDALPTYRSPQQILGEPPCEQSDMYSLGMIAYEVLAGRPPFSAKDGSLPNPAKLALLHLDSTPPALKAVRKPCSPGVSAFVARLTTTKPEERFDTHKELLEEADVAYRGFELWRDLHNIMGTLGPTMKAIKRRVEEAPYTVASSGHRYSKLFTVGMSGLPPPTPRQPQSKPDSGEDGNRDPSDNGVDASAAGGTPANAMPIAAAMEPAAIPEAAPVAIADTTNGAHPVINHGAAESEPRGDHRLVAGKKIGEFTITRVLEPLGCVERSLGVRDNGDGNKVVIACARRSPSSPSGAEVHRLLLALQKTKADGCAPIVAGNLDEQEGYAWLAREHITDAIWLGDFLAAASDCPHELTVLQAGVQTFPLESRLMLALGLAVGVASTLEQFAVEGIVHGGLHPRSTLALQTDGMPIVFDIGHCQLFRQDPYVDATGAPDFRAPELLAGNEPDVRSDIYTLGAIIYWMLSGAVPTGERPPRLVDTVDPSLETISLAIERALEREPAKRWLNWKAFYEPLRALCNALAALDGVASVVSGSGGMTGMHPEGAASAACSPPVERGADTDPCDPPSACDGNAKDSAPAAAPTPRVPELPARVGDLPALVPTDEPAHEHNTARSVQRTEARREPAPTQTPILPGQKAEPERATMGVGGSPPATPKPSRRGGLWVGGVALALALLIALIARGSDLSSPLVLIGPKLSRFVPTVPLEPSEERTKIETSISPSDPPSAAPRRPVPCPRGFRCKLTAGRKLSINP